MLHIYPYPKHEVGQVDNIIWVTYLVILKKEPTNVPKHNGPVYTVCHILRHIMASGVEAEIAALFKNCQDAVVLRNTLRNLEYPQLPTPIKIYNSTIAEIANNTILQRKSRTMDMRFYWVRDRVNQDQFIIYFRPSVTNLDDYLPNTNHPHTISRYVTTMCLILRQRSPPFKYIIICKGVFICPNRLVHITY